jgi:hypothetical protein
MKRFFLAIVLMMSAPSLSSAVDLVKNGQPLAEIVIPAGAGPSITLAAEELQAHLQKISGARLPIVSNLTEGVKTKVYVGESEHTRRLGITLDDVKHDGFKIVAKDDYVALVGREFSIRPTLGKYAGLDSHKQRALWKEETGTEWRFPGITDMRGQQFGVFVDDGTGTLYAVYDLLEQLGMRWYLPMADLGIVYPATKDVRIKPQELKREPHFAVRQFNNGMGRYKDEWLWYKFMKLGTSRVFPQTHTLEYILDNRDAYPPEFFARIGGKLNPHVPRLSSEVVRAETVAYLEAMIKAYPRLEYVPISMPDGFMAIDEEDAKKWRRPDAWGTFSDYVWDFIVDVRQRVKAKHPHIKFSTFAYSEEKLPPNNVEKIPDDISISFCQNSTMWMYPNIRRDLQVREDWLKRIGNGKMMVYDYYFDHAPSRNFPPVPVIFTRFMEENFRGMYGRATLGFWVDTSWHTGDEYKWCRSTLRRPGISHLMVYLHNRFAWDDKLDLAKTLEEYYRLFFGPAQKEMKEFYELSEEVWVRPVKRTISLTGGWLTAVDVGRYFDILKRAKAKAGDTIYGKRIDLIVSEITPLTYLFAQLKRTGPVVEGWRRHYLPPPVIDGDLEKEFWTERGATFSNEGFRIFFHLQDMFTGLTPPHVDTTVSFRWMTDHSALIVGIECMEPRMDRVKANGVERDSAAINEDDTIEIRVETPQGIRPVIIINPNGAVYDECITENVADLPTLYSAGAVAVKKYPDRWTAEVRIDTKPINGEKPSEYMPWGINVCRKRMAGNTVEYYMLSPSGTDFKDAGSMANLIIRP